MSKWDKQLSRYYASLESRAGYKLMLGGYRHFGYYSDPQAWPFPVGRALEAMQTMLLNALDLPPGSLLLDSGCGVGLTAVNMVRRGGFVVDAIDFMEHHVKQTQSKIREAGLEGRMTVQQRDFHHLEELADNTYDGLWTMETLVHAWDPETVLRGYHRILKPGGVMVLHEYDHLDPSEAPEWLQDDFAKIWDNGSLHAWSMFYPGVLEKMLEEAGFEVVFIHDLSANIVPMLWLFYIVAFLPCLVVKLLHLERYFINTVSGVAAYRGRKYWRMLQYKVRKPVHGMPDRFEPQAVNGVQERFP